MTEQKPPKHIKYRPQDKNKPKCPKCYSTRLHPWVIENMMSNHYVCMKCGLLLEKYKALK